MRLMLLIGALVAVVVIAVATSGVTQVVSNSTNPAAQNFARMSCNAAIGPWDAGGGDKGRHDASRLNDAQLIAELWAENWIKPPPDNDVNKWLAQLRPYTTEEFLAQMATIDPKNVPDKITQKVAAKRSTVSSADFEVGTDTGKVVITLIKLSPSNEWRVNGYTKAS